MSASPSPDNSILFSPARIGTLEVKNRLVMPAMVRNYADEKGHATPRYVAHIERIAQGGVGTMILEASFISQEGRGFANELGIQDDSIIPGLKMLVDAAHRHGAAIGPQLYHAGRQTTSKVTGLKPAAPSPVPDPLEQEMPRELTVDEIHKIAGAFGAAASRTKSAGCDFVEIHGAHGYLINQFLSPFSNKRNDQYGGSFENRMRFALEVIAAVREQVGAKFPIIIRLSADEIVPGGLTIEDAVLIARGLEGGVNAINVSVGNYGSYTTGRMLPLMIFPDGILIPLASAIKRAVKVPVIAVGKIRTAELAASVIRNGDADFVAIGRGLLADPDWPRKVQSGRLLEINHCIACNQGCISRLFAQKDVWCTVNPECGREEVFSRASAGGKMVFIAGGGPAGMEAARVATMRGHQVVLFERSDHLGGQLRLSGSTPHRPGWNELQEYLLEEMDRLRIDVRLFTKLTREIVEREHPDAVIVATGSFQSVPPIPIGQDAHVVTGRDLLKGTAQASGRIAIVGGGSMGVHMSELLAEKGHAVTIIEATGEIAVDAPLDDRNLLLGRLEGLRVRTVVNTFVISIDASGVTVKGQQGNGHIPAETVVVCVGNKSDIALANELAGIPNVKVVGDALKPRSVTEAMEEGALAALEL